MEMTLLLNPRLARRRNVLALHLLPRWFQLTMLCRLAPAFLRTRKGGPTPGSCCHLTFSDVHDGIPFLRVSASASNQRVDAVPPIHAAKARVCSLCSYWRGCRLVLGLQIMVDGFTESHDIDICMIRASLKFRRVICACAFLSTT
ncbi:hypothetical protein OG21DRAFT_135702 [Imleria badia]|nr:hypothetical protein OG21DRAFT_135702 [Imleria badia]